MSRTGQSPLVEIVRMERPVVAYPQDYAPGDTVQRHRHPVGQLIYAATGVMTVTTRDGAWVVPPQRAVWVPPFVTHAIRMTGVVTMRTVYVEPMDGLPQTCGVVQVSSLLRELVLRAVSFRQPYDVDGADARIATVLLDEIKAAPVAPLHLKLPTDARALRVVRALEADPGDARSLATWGKAAGASSRTLARVFRAETGLGFRAWRQQLRLLRALERLADGDAVTTVAIELGYDSPSAFIAMFKKALGVPPSQYFVTRATRRRARSASS
jgi:AraC-like DNA-binding protein